MFDFIKIFLEEPNKLNKLGFAVLKTLLALIFASKLYIWLIGNYELIDIYNFKAWFEFVLSGNILYCILVYFFSYALLYYLLPMFSTDLFGLIVNSLFSKPVDIFDRSFINWFLNFINIIKIEKKTKIISTTKQTEAFLDIIVSYQKKEAQEEISVLKNSFLSKVIHTYLVFVLSYFFLLKIHTSTLSIIIIVIGIMLAIIYFEICLVIEYLNCNSKELLHLLQGLIIAEKIPKAIKEKNLILYDIEIAEMNLKLQYTRIKDKEFILAYYCNKEVLPGRLIKQYYKIIESTKKSILLFTNKELSENASEKANQIKDSLSIIHFEKEEDLFIKLNEFLEQ